MTRSTGIVLSFRELEALVKEQERTIRRLKRSLKKTGPHEDLAAELESAKALRTRALNHRDVSQAVFMIGGEVDDAVHTQVRELPARALPRAPLLLGMGGVAFAEIDGRWHVQLSGPFPLTVVQTDVPGLLDVVQMRFARVTVEGSGEDAAAALCDAEAQLIRELRQRADAPEGTPTPWL